jgi:acyl-CoA synthetase (NDP forming)
MWGHEGNLYAVNRNGLPAHGVPGFKSCTDIPDRVDMAYIYVPAAAVVGAIRDAAAAGIRNAVILTSGFAEVGPEGVALQNEVRETAAAAGMRLMGPNSLGFVNVVNSSVTTSISTREPIHRGGLSIVSQSGAIAQEIYNFAHSQGFGVGFVGATGNEADIGMADVVDYLVDDPAIGAIMLYVESIKHSERFIESAARAFAARKPIVMLKLGRSKVAAEVAQAHTGSLVGDDGVFDAMCHRYGISRVSSIEELVITASLLEKVGPIDPPRIGMISLSGGACAVYSDLAEAAGVDCPPFSDATKAELRTFLPSFAATINPMDVTGAVVNDPSLWLKVIPTVCNDPGFGLIVTTTVVPNVDWELANMRWDIDSIVEGYRLAGRQPVVAGITLQDRSAIRRDYFEEVGLEAFIPNLDVGVRALGHLQRWSERLLIGELGKGGKVAAVGERPVGERATLDFLASKGVPIIPATLARSADEAAAAAAKLDARAVLKIASPDIAHKTEAGGVRLDVEAGDAGRVFDEIMASARAYAPDARIDGVIVSPMRGQAVELIVGVARDPEWGPVIAVGFGGTMAEILGDSKVRLLPIGRDEVKEMLLSLRMAELLQGFRGAPRADLDKLADAIVAIGDAALALGPDLAALEINPLRVDGATIEALDGLTVYAAK